jgi:chemotaxis protein CheD
MRQRVDVFLVPGDLSVHADPLRIKTIVGSCVAVCLWDAAARVGGVNHYLLAEPAPKDVPGTRFGSYANRRLIELVCQAGGRPHRLEASVIGGGHPVDSIRTHAIGDDNVAVALDVLEAHGIRVVRRETGGDFGRKLLFSTADGTLLVRPLGNKATALARGDSA